MIAIMACVSALGGPLATLSAELDVGGQARRSWVGARLVEPLRPTLGLGVRLTSRDPARFGGHLRVRSWQTAGLAGSGRRGLVDLGGAAVFALGRGSWRPVVGILAGPTLGLPSIPELSALAGVQGGAHLDLFFGVRHGRMAAELGWGRAALWGSDPSTYTALDQLGIRIALDIGRDGARSPPDDGVTVRRPE